MFSLVNVVKYTFWWSHLNNYDTKTRQLNKRHIQVTGTDLLSQTQKFFLNTHTATIRVYTDRFCQHSPIEVQEHRVNHSWQNESCFFSHLNCLEWRPIPSPKFPTTNNSGMSDMRGWFDEKRFGSNFRNFLNFSQINLIIRAREQSSTDRAQNSDWTEQAISEK